MTAIIPYLTFNGNCREAMEHYKACIGGQLYFQDLGSAPAAAEIPAAMLKSILHASLSINGKVLLMGTDMVSEKGLLRGNSVALSLNCSSEEEIRARYQLLAAGGKAVHALQETHWNAIFGGLTDKFGNQWLLNYERNANL